MVQELRFKKTPCSSKHEYACLSAFTIKGIHGIIEKRVSSILFTFTIVSLTKSYSNRLSWSWSTGGKSMNRTPFLASWKVILEKNINVGIISWTKIFSKFYFNIEEGVSERTKEEVSRLSNLFWHYLPVDHIVQHDTYYHLQDVPLPHTCQKKHKHPDSPWHQAEDLHSNAHKLVRPIINLL